MATGNLRADPSCLQMCLRQFLVHLNGFCAAIVGLQLIRLAEVPEQRDQVPVLAAASLLLAPPLMLPASLLHLYKMSANLLACALGSDGRPLSSVHESLTILAIGCLSRSHEVLVDGCATVRNVRFEGVLLLSAASWDGAAVALLDRRANREGLDDWVPDDVRLVEETRVVVLAGHAVASVVVLGVMLLRKAMMSTTPGLMEMQSGRRCRTAGKVSIRTINEVLAAALDVEASRILCLRCMKRSEICSVF